MIKQNPLPPDSTHGLLILLSPDRLVRCCCKPLSQRLQTCFATIEDPRVERLATHLSDILTIAILSVMAGGWGGHGIVWGEQTRLVIDVSGSSQRDTE